MTHPILVTHQLYIRDVVTSLESAEAYRQAGDQELVKIQLELARSAVQRLTVEINECCKVFGVN